MPVLRIVNLHKDKIMALGTNRTRNWGKDTQIAALSLLLHSRKVAYKTQEVKSYDGLTHKSLWLTPSANGITLPFIESVANLVNTARGRWEALHPFDGRLLAKGISERDVIRSTIEKVWC